MKYPFDVDSESPLIERPDNAPQDLNNVAYQHDIKLKELDVRLRNLEQLVNQLQNKVGLWWS